MVFAINSNLFSIKFNSFFDKWSLDQGQKTINPLVPLFKSLPSEASASTSQTMFGTDDGNETVATLPRFVAPKIFLHFTHNRTSP